MFRFHNSIELALCLLYFVLPSQIQFSQSGGASAQNFVVIFLLTACFFCSKHPSPLDAEQKKYVNILILFCFWCLFSSLWSLSPEKSYMSVLTRMLPHTITCFLVLRYIDSKRLLDKLLDYYILGTLVNSVVSLFFFRTSKINAIHGLGAEAAIRNSVWGADPNELATLFAMGIVFALYKLGEIKHDPQKKFFYWGTAITASGAILTTASRTGFVLLLLIWGYNYFRNKHLNKVFLTILIILFASIALYKLPKSTFERLFETKQQLIEGNLTGRGEIWKAGFDKMEEMECYFQGIGFRTYPIVTSRALPWTAFYGGLGSHNSYIGVLIETGLIGFTIYFCLIFILFKACVQMSRITRSRVYILFFLPLAVSMFTLDVVTQRWLFLFAPLILKYRHFIIMQEKDFHYIETKRSL